MTVYSSLRYDINETLPDQNKNQKFNILGQKQSKLVEVSFGVAFVVGSYNPGGYSGFQVTAWSNGGKNQDPNKSQGLPTKPKKIPGPQIN